MPVPGKLPKVLLVRLERRMYVRNRQLGEGEVVAMRRADAVRLAGTDRVTILEKAPSRAALKALAEEEEGLEEEEEAGETEEAVEGPGERATQPRRRDAKR